MTFKFSPPECPLVSGNPCSLCGIEKIRWMNYPDPEVNRRMYNKHLDSQNRAHAVAWWRELERLTLVAKEQQ